MRLWQVVGLLAAVLALKAAVSSSSGWFMALLGLHDVFSWTAPALWEGAASMAALAALLRWARP